MISRALTVIESYVDLELHQNHITVPWDIKLLKLTNFYFAINLFLRFVTFTCDYFMCALFLLIDQKAHLIKSTFIPFESLSKRIKQESNMWTEYISFIEIRMNQTCRTIVCIVLVSPLLNVELKYCGILITNSFYNLTWLKFDVTLRSLNKEH